MNKIEFCGQISPIMSAIRMGGDSMRITFDVPLTERVNAIGLLALTDQPLRLTIQVDNGKHKPKPEKGEHGKFWEQMFAFRFQNNPDLIEKLDCAGPTQVKLRLRDLFETDSLTNVSPEQWEEWCNSEGLTSLVTLSRQAVASLQEKE